MATLTALQAVLQTHIGTGTAGGSSGGGLNNKLGSLLAYVSGGTNGSTAPDSNSMTRTTFAPPDVTWGTSGFTQVASSGFFAGMPHPVLSGIYVEVQTTVGFSTLGNKFQVDIASGAVGAEVIVWQTHLAATASIAVSAESFPIFPPIQWPNNGSTTATGERLSVRGSGDGTAVILAVTPIFTGQFS